MIHISPVDARGRVAGIFTTSFMVGVVCGPAIGGLAGEFGVDRSVHHLRRRDCWVWQWCCSTACGIRQLTAPVPPTRTTVTMREALRFRAYRSALLSNFATGWSAFGLRVALVPLFVSDVMGRGVGIIGLVLAMFAAGNAVAVIPSGYLSDRMGRRTLLMVGLAASGAATIWLGAAVVVAGVSGRGVCGRRDDGHLHVADAGRRRRHPGQ